jgi:hypothetical protein
MNTGDLVCYSEELTFKNRGPNKKGRCWGFGTILVTMRLLTLLPTLGLVGQGLATSHAFPDVPQRSSEIPSDKAVKEYFAKLAPTTKSTLLHDTTGPEAGADVRAPSDPPPPYSPRHILH